MKERRSVAETLLSGRSKIQSNIKWLIVVVIEFLIYVMVYFAVVVSTFLFLFGQLDVRWSEQRFIWFISAMFENLFFFFDFTNRAQLCIYLN